MVYSIWSTIANLQIYIDPFYQLENKKTENEDYRKFRRTQLN